MTKLSFLVAFSALLAGGAASGAAAADADLPLRPICGAMDCSSGASGYERYSFCYEPEWFESATAELIELKLSSDELKRLDRLRGERWARRWRRNAIDHLRCYERVFSHRAIAAPPSTGAGSSDFPDVVDNEISAMRDAGNAGAKARAIRGLITTLESLDKTPR